MQLPADNTERYEATNDETHTQRDMYIYMHISLLYIIIIINIRQFFFVTFIHANPHPPFALVPGAAKPSLLTHVLATMDTWSIFTIIIYHP
jgi:hypothetical protein